jgi:hypothetical protein
MNVVVVAAHLVQMHSAFRSSSDSASAPTDVGGLLHDSDSSYSMAGYRGDDPQIELDSHDEDRKVVDRIVTEDYSVLSAGSPQVSARRMGSQPMTEVSLGTMVSKSQSRQQNREHQDDI